MKHVFIIQFITIIFDRQDFKTYLKQQNKISNVNGKWLPMSFISEERIWAVETIEN